MVVCANRPGPATMPVLPELPVTFPISDPAEHVHVARLILILSLAPTIGLGIGRFAY